MRPVDQKTEAMSSAVMEAGCRSGRVFGCWKSEEQEAASKPWAFPGLSAPGAPRALSSTSFGK